MRISSEKARQIMLNAGLTPIAPYRRADVSWPCVHVETQKVVYPRLDKVKAGWRGCRSCSQKHRGSHPRRPTIDPALATEVMLRAGLTPLAPYQSSKTPWPCRHLCGRLVRPRLDSILLGQGPCWLCATRKYVPELPGCVYLIQSTNHPGYPSPVLKIGVTNNRGWTRTRWWRLVTEARFTNGTVPLEIERDVLMWLTGDLGLEPVRSATGSTGKGFAEAIKIADLTQAGVSVTDVIDRVSALARARTEETSS